MINLDSVSAVARFVAAATETGLPIKVSDGKTTSECSSIMELVCLNLTEPLVAKVQCTDEEFVRLLRKVEPFLAD